MKCVVADDIYPDKKGLSKLRRARAKKIIKHELIEREVFDADEDRIMQERDYTAPIGCGDSECEICHAKYWYEDAMELNEESVGKLANCVIFALKHMKTAHGGMMYRTFPDGTCKMLSWEDDFIEALKGVGIEIDREKLNAVRNPPKRKKTESTPTAHGR